MQVYCDNAATTRPYDDVVAAVAKTMKDVYGNPSSEHRAGSDAADVLRKSRHEIAALLGAKDSEIYFTSGASESNNWVIQGVMREQALRGKKYIITSEFEHHSVLNTVDGLAGEGIIPLYVRPDSSGFIDPKDVEYLIEKHDGKVGLVSIMFVNNELGTIQPITQIADVCRAHGVLLHVDATQAVGHIRVDVGAYGMDMMSFSGHKFHGPRGIGGLYVKSGVDVPNFIFGGKQERGMRAGTENLPGIVGMAVALDISDSHMVLYNNRTISIRNWIAEELCDVDGVHLNGALASHVPGILNFTFDGVEGESLLLMLDTYGIAASAGSACATGSIEPSHVLRAIGCTKEQAMCSIRLSFGTEMTFEMASYVVDTIKKCVAILRSAAEK